MIRSFLLGQNNSTIRDRDWQAICSELQFSRGGLEVLAHEHVFWFGDFNYRVEQDAGLVKTAIEEGRWMEMLQYDQLRPRMADGRVFVGFVEAPITFPPTYKFDPGTNIYDTSEKQRVPSWCDRILYKCSLAEAGRRQSRLPTAELTDLSAPNRPLGDANYASSPQDPPLCLLYRSIPIDDSDHKPVTAVFDVPVYRLDPARLRNLETEVYLEMTNLINLSSDNFDYSISSKSSTPPPLPPRPIKDSLI